MSISDEERARRARLSEAAQQDIEERDDRWRHALCAIGVKVERITATAVRFHDERGSRPFTTPIVSTGNGTIDMSSGDIDFNTESLTLAALQRDVARMRGIRLMELLNEDWTIDRIDQGQREALGRAMYKLGAYVDGAIAVAVDALLVDPSKAREVLNDAPFRHIALAVAKERVAEIKGLEAAALLPDKLDVVFRCDECKQEFKSAQSRNWHECRGANYDILDGSFGCPYPTIHAADCDCGGVGGPR